MRGTVACDSFLSPWYIICEVETWVGIIFTCILAKMKKNFIAREILTLVNNRSPKLNPVEGLKTFLIGGHSSFHRTFKP
jgi:hypothetical protein